MKKLVAVLTGAALVVAATWLSGPLWGSLAHFPNVAQVLSVFVIDNGLNSAPPEEEATSTGGGGGPVSSPRVCDVGADVNGDNKVNLADFSIMAYWYKRPLTSSAPHVDLNCDGVVSLADFSVLAYYWNR